MTRASKYADAPYHSPDPVDWFMYADQLIDRGAPVVNCRATRRVGESLKYCPELRCAWFAHDPNWPARAALLPIESAVLGPDLLAHGRPIWVRPAWVADRDVFRVPQPWHGTPWRANCSAMEAFLEWANSTETEAYWLRLEFFWTHSRKRMPKVWRHREGGVP